MPARVSPTLRVLLEIRDELRTHRAILEHHGELLEHHGQRLDGLERAHREGEVRVATELIAVAKAVTDVKELLRSRLDDRDRIDEIDRRVSILERRAS